MDMKCLWFLLIFKGILSEQFSYYSTKNESYVPHPDCEGVASDVSIGSTAEYI